MRRRRTMLATGDWKRKEAHELDAQIPHLQYSLSLVEGTLHFPYFYCTD
jgi:hypothetical protein